MCGIFGVINHPDAANVTRLGLYALQHRGEESAGIAAYHEDKTRRRRGMGLVSEVFPGEIDDLPGQNAVGQTRYSTAGLSDEANAQPIMGNSNFGDIVIAHNGNLTNAIGLRNKLQAQGAIFQGTADTENILHLIGKSTAPVLTDAVSDAAGMIEGAFSLVIMVGNVMMGIRDPSGFRPLVLGKLGNGYVLASETCALSQVNAKFVRDVQPGEIVYLKNENGKVRDGSIRFGPKMPLSQCIFEDVYFSRPDSRGAGSLVKSKRNLMGKIMAEESHIDADLIIPIPDSGVEAALGYARASGIPYETGFIRNHYIGRTFISPGQDARRAKVRVKLSPIREVFEGKRVILVDDSIVRSTTSAETVAMAFESGAREVHLRISSPPTKSPCRYGIDTPTQTELIGAGKEIEGIRQAIGASSLAYLSLRGLLQAVGSGGDGYCVACFTTKYPTRIRDLETN